MAGSLIIRDPNCLADGDKVSVVAHDPLGNVTRSTLFSRFKFDNQVAIATSSGSFFRRDPAFVVAQISIPRNR